MQTTIGEGSLKAESMITNVVPLERTVTDGVMALAKGYQVFCKFLVEVNYKEKT
jgi:hypothetical protein